MPTRSLQISPDALYQEIGGEVVILDLASSSYFGLDAVGMRVWQLLQEISDQQVIIELMLAEYDVAPEQLQQDVENFLQSLIDAGLVRAVDA